MYKRQDPIPGEAPLAERANMLYSGCFVTYGRGRAVVTAIGMQTEVGKIAGLLKSATEKQTPLQVSLEEFGKKLSVLILAPCSLPSMCSGVKSRAVPSCLRWPWRWLPFPRP